MALSYNEKIIIAIVFAIIIIGIAIAYALWKIDDTDRKLFDDIQYPVVKRKSAK